MRKERRRGNVILTGGALAAYHVGALYFSTDSTDPGTLFGGTWERFAKGRVVVGVDEAQTEFDTALETGGAKTHTLTTAEMPNHTHTVPAHNHTIAHTHGIPRRDAVGSSTDATARGGGTAVANTPTDPSSNANSGTQGATATTDSGGGGSHNNLQPYIAVYIWRRTA